MNWDNDSEVAQRAAEIPPFTYEAALDALRAGGDRRQLIFKLIRGHEEAEDALTSIRNVRRSLRRHRLGLL
jgi:hypothetical protein